MIRDFSNKAVLVTGGTKGIGLSIALEFARRGASCILTYRWGSADEDEVRARFTDAGGPAPLIVQADAAESEDTDALLAEVKKSHDAIDVFISNVAGSVVVQGFEDMTERALAKSLHYSAWPTFEYLQKMKAVFGRYPRYAVAMSSPGPDSYNPGYEFVAASKAVLETLVRYTSYRLREDDIRINVVRAAALDTQSTRDMFGDELFEFLERLAPPKFEWLKEADVAGVVLALCSGLMDGVRGQVLTVDRGMLFSDNLMRLYAQRESLNL
jgi:NAD(P)-dependent dehydrogenase (short-subunit alcohol dehydrogenase family)